MIGGSQGSDPVISPRSSGSAFTDSVFVAPIFNKAAVNKEDQLYLEYHSVYKCF